MDRALAAVLRKIEDGLNREGDVQTRIQEELRPMGFELDRWDALPDHRNLTADLPGNVAGYTFELVVGDVGEGCKAMLVGFHRDRQAGCRIG